METKICTKCGIEKPLTEFVKNKTKKNGYASECKECKHKRYLDYYKNNKSKFYANKKRHKEKIKDYINSAKSCGCKLCGEKDIACLDFHHINGKDFTVGQKAKDLSFDVIKKEIGKCIVLCSNCHRKVHYYNLNIA